MLRWTLLSICCLLCATSSTRANILVWEGTAAHCTISDVNNTITINEPGTYGFRAWNPSTQALETMQLIEVNPAVTGDVTVTIAWDENGGNGAVNLWTGTLALAGYDVDLAGLEISGNIATTGDFTCDNITGTVDIDGNIGVIAGTKKFFVQNAIAPIIVHGSLWAYNTLEAETLDDLTIYGVGITPVQGDIHVTNSYSGTLLIEHSFGGDLDCDANVPGSISITGVNTGLVNVDANLSGTISIGSNLNEPGRIVIDGYVSQSDPNVPAIHVGGGVVGSSASAIPIVIGGELDGVLAIDGPLENVAPSAVEIQVGSIDTENLGAIAIDYDGYHSGDVWDENARIKVDTTEYSGNSPAAHVYDIQICVGDMDNDRDLDSNDPNALDLGRDFPES